MSKEVTQLFVSKLSCSIREFVATAACSNAFPRQLQWQSSHLKSQCFNLSQRRVGRGMALPSNEHPVMALTVALTFSDWFQRLVGSQQPAWCPHLSWAGPLALVARLSPSCSCSENVISTCRAVEAGKIEGQSLKETQYFLSCFQKSRNVWQRRQLPTNDNFTLHIY